MNLTYKEISELKTQIEKLNNDIREIRSEKE
jgi:hypothetical protein